jgi:hypothetical protein
MNIVIFLRSPQPSILLKGASSKPSASRPTNIIVERLGKVFFEGIGLIFERFCTSLAKPPVQAIRSAGWLQSFAPQ